jgi:hypothetical protein
MDSDAPPKSQKRPVEALVLDDGTRAVVHERGLEIHDARGRLLVRYADGAAIIEVPEGDMTLSAPNGRVVIQSAEDIVLEAAREVRHSAGSKLTLSAGPRDAERPPQVSLSPDLAQIEAKQLRAVADRSQGWVRTRSG